MKISRLIPPFLLCLILAGALANIWTVGFIWALHGIPKTGLESNFTGRGDAESARQLAILKKRVMGGRKADEAKLPEANPPKSVTVFKNAESGSIVVMGPPGITLPKHPEITSKMLVDEAFEVGAKLGARVVLKGGDRKDLESMIDSFKSGDVETVKKWFDEHEAK